MNKNKTIQILKSFTSEEFKKFEKFVQSPYFTTSKDSFKLLKILKKFYPSFENKSFKIEKIAKAFNPDEVPDKMEGRIRNTLTDLNHLARNFLSIEYYAASESLMKSAEVSKLYEKQLINLWKKESDYYFSKFGEVTNLNEAYINENISLYGLMANHLLNFGKPQKDKNALVKHSELTGIRSIQNILGSKRLEFAVEGIFNVKYENLNGKMFELFDFKKLMEYIEDKFPEAHKIISPEYYSLKMFLNQDFDESNKKIEELFFKNLKTGKSADIFTGSFCVNWLNGLVMQMDYRAPVSDIKPLAKKTLPIVDFYLQKMLYNDVSTLLPMGSFVSFLYYGVKAGDAEWIKQLIEKHSCELHPDKKEYTINFAWGIYYGCKEDYNKALSYYSKINSSESVISENTKSEVMECHYHLGNFDEAFSYSEAVLRGYERKGKGNIPRWGIEFVKLFRELLKIVTGKQLEKHDKFEELKLKIAKASPQVQFKFANKKILSKVK